MKNHSRTKIIIPRLGTTLVPAATRQNDVVTGADNIPVGAFGLFAPVASSGNPVVPALASVGRTFKFVQRRDQSRDPQTLLQRKFEESAYITTNCLNGVKIQGEAARTGANNIWLLGPTAAAPTVGAIIPQSEFTYSTKVSSHGSRIDEISGLYNTPTITSFYTTPDFTLTTLTTAQQIDVIVQNLAYTHNQQSGTAGNYSCMLCLSTASANGGITVATAAALPVNSTITVGFNKIGAPAVLTLSKDIKNALTQAAVTLGALFIQPYVIEGSTGVQAIGAPQNAGIPPVAGVTVGGLCNRLLVMSIDMRRAVYDYRVALKSRLEIGLFKGLDSVNKAQVVRAEEGYGQPEQIKLFFDEDLYLSGEQGLRHDAFYVSYPSELKADATYDVFTIEYCTHTGAMNGAPNQDYQSIHVALINTEDATTPYFTGAPNPQKTALQAYLNAFNTQNNLGNPTVAI